MITGRQIRAARGLLRWRVEDLAQHTGLTREALTRMEDDAVQPREASIAKISRAFESQGVEFLDNQGVRFRPEGIDVFNGQGGLEAFFDQVYEFLKAQGGMVCVSGVDEAQFAAHHGAEHAAAHIKRMKKLTAQRDDIRFKVLIEEGDTNYMASDYCQYKWMSRDNFVPTPFYVFGDKLALITFQTTPSPKIMLIRSEVFAEAYRKQFDIAWRDSKDPPSKGGEL